MPCSGEAVISNTCLFLPCQLERTAINSWEHVQFPLASPFPLESVKFKIGREPEVSPTLTICFDLLILTFFSPFPFQLYRRTKPWPRGTSTRLAIVLGERCSWLCSPLQLELASMWAWLWPSSPTSPRTITYDELPPGTQGKNLGPVACRCREIRAGKRDSYV